MEKTDPHYPPPDIEAKIREAFPSQGERIMREIRWSNLDGCWLFEVHGMTVGCEPDGYIHS